MNAVIGIPWSVSAKSQRLGEAVYFSLAGDANETCVVLGRSQIHRVDVSPYRAGILSVE